MSDNNIRKRDCPESKVYMACMGPTWVLSAPGGLHAGPMNLARRVSNPYFWLFLVVRGVL